MNIFRVNIYELSLISKPIVQGLQVFSTTVLFLLQHSVYFPSLLTANSL